MIKPDFSQPVPADLGTVHFIGIGGIGMSGIAELLVNLGYDVTGSDAHRSPVTDRLTALGVRVDYGHAPSHVEGADVVVVSSAIRQSNAEVAEAVGYADRVAFGRLFKRHTGMTPAAWRQRHQVQA